MVPYYALVASSPDDDAEISDIDASASGDDCEVIDSA